MIQEKSRDCLERETTSRHRNEFEIRDRIPLEVLSYTESSNEWLVKLSLKNILSYCKIQTSYFFSDQGRMCKLIIRSTNCISTLVNI